MALLRRMFYLAKQEGKLQSIPYFPMLKENPPRKGFLTYEQFQQLLAALAEQLHDIISLLYATGCRLGEATKIRWSQVDLDAGLIRLGGEQTKTAQPRIVPLPDVLVNSLRQQSRQATPTARVFSVNDLRKAWIAACIKAGFGRLEELPGGGQRYDGLIVHDMRRSAIRKMVRAGVSDVVSMKISGHKTRAVFDRYNITSEEDVRHAIGRVQTAQQALLAENNAKTTQIALVPKRRRK